MSNATTPPYAVLAADGYFFAPDAADPGTVSVVLADPSGAAAALTMDGLGTLDLSVQATAAGIGNTYTGGTFIYNGTVGISNWLCLPGLDSVTAPGGIDNPGNPASSGTRRTLTHGTRPPSGTRVAPTMARPLPGMRRTKRFSRQLPHPVAIAVANGGNPVQRRGDRV